MMARPSRRIGGFEIVGDGRYSALIDMVTGGGTRTIVVRFPEPPTVGSRFAFDGAEWNVRRLGLEGAVAEPSGSRHLPETSSLAHA